MEEAYKILEYLPLNAQYDEYIHHLWDTFKLNYQDKKHQFAFLAYHMLFMCFVYYEIWKIRLCAPKVFETALIGFKDDEVKTILTSNFPFVLHKLGESEVFKLLKLSGVTNSDVGEFKQIVKCRNNAAHTNGQKNFTEQNTLNTIIKKIVKYIKIIQKKVQVLLNEPYFKFLKDSTDAEEREYLDINDQINEELIHKYLLSKTDVHHLTKSDLSSLQQEDDYNIILEFSIKLKRKEGESAFFNW